MLFGSFFLVLHFLLSRFTSSMLCCISKSLVKHLQKPDWRLDLPLFSYSYQKCMFVESLTEYIGPVLPVVFTIEIGVVNKI